MKVGVFHVGTQHSWQTARAFQEAGQLAWYATSVFYKPNDWPYKLERMVPAGMSKKLHREFTRRHTPMIDESLVSLVGPYEWPRTLARRMNLSLLDHGFNLLNIRAVSRGVVRMLKQNPVDVIWGFNSMSDHVFAEARKQGVVCILDQTIGHPAAMNEVLVREAKVNGDYFINPYREFSPEWLARQDREVSLAHKVVVGSQFCGETMLARGCPAEKLQLLPYGYDETRFSSYTVRAMPPVGRPLRFLCVGTVEPRKGSHYLIEAFRRIPPEVATLTMVGRSIVPATKIASASSNIRFIPQVPRSEIAGYFADADCFIMPSLFEGSALVLYEALGAGLGIIQTPAAGFGVAHGRNGILLPMASADAIVAAVQSLAHNRQWVETWSRESLQIAREYRWADYRAKCQELAAKMVAKS